MEKMSEEQKELLGEAWGIFHQIIRLTRDLAEMNWSLAYFAAKTAETMIDMYAVHALHKESKEITKEHKKQED